MPKIQHKATSQVIKEEECPACLKKGKTVLRLPSKMARHYEKRHPNKKVPSQYYQGPKDLLGNPIPEYAGKFQVGTRVKLVGVERSMDGLPCPFCIAKGKDKPRKNMKRHVLKRKHKNFPWPPTFVFHRELEEYVKDGEVIGKKGTVASVTPEGYAGTSIPAIIHVRLDIPIGMKYYDKAVVSVYEEEIKRLKPKVE